MGSTRSGWTIALPLAVAAGIAIAVLILLRPRLGGVADSQGGAVGAGRAAGDSTGLAADASRGSGERTRVAGAQAGPPQDVPGDEPIWGARVSGLFPGAIEYSLDVDGRWLADPKNPRLLPRPDVARGIRTEAQVYYHSVLAWPFPAGQCPESVRVVSAATAEIRYTGRIRSAALFRSPLRGDDWGTDELQPLNEAARANLAALRSDPALGSVRGVVVGAGRQPLAGALVQISQDREIGNTEWTARRTVATGEDGRFECDRLECGSATAVARAAGWQMSHSVPVCVAHGGNLQPVEIVLTRGGIVGGSVTDVGGRPVPLAEVLACPASTRPSGWPDAPVSAHTDRAGLYSHASLAPGVYDFVVLAAGHPAEVRQGVQVGEEGTPLVVDFVVHNGVTIRGRVTQGMGDSREGVAGATVAAYVRGMLGVASPRSEAMRPWRTLTGPDGAFALAGVLPGSELQFEAASGLLGTSLDSPVVVREGTTQPSVELHLGAAARLKGRTVDATGAPVAGADVCPVTEISDREEHQQSDHDLAEPLSQATAGADGRWTLANLKGGAAYVLQARAPGFATVYSAPIPSDSSKDIVLRLTPGGTIAGRVTERQTGSPIEGAHLQAFASTDDASPLASVSTVSGLDGCFRFVGLAPGSYTIGGRGSMVDTEGTPCTVFVHSAEPVKVTEGVTRDVAVVAERAAAIRGRVVADETGAPVEGAGVRLAERDHEPWGGALDAFTGADGAFEMAHLLAGSYGLNAAVPGFANPDAYQVLARVTVGPGETAQGVEIRLSRGGTVRGLVLDPDGRPAPGIALRAVTDRTNSPSATTDSQGRFEMAGLPYANAFRAEKKSAVGPGGEWIGSSEEVRLTREAPTADVTIRLHVGGSISGHCADEDGKAVTGAKIVCRVVDAATAPFFYGKYVSSNADGEYTVTGLTTGTYRIQGDAEEHESAEVANVAVAMGQSSNGVDLTFAKCPTREIGGQLATLAGQPLAGWRLSFEPTARFRRNVAVTTDEDGKFRLKVQEGATGAIRLLYDGAYHPGPYCGAYSGETDPFAPEIGGQPEPLRIAVDMAHSVRGRLVAAGSGTPLPGLTVKIACYSNRLTPEPPPGWAVARVIEYHGEYRTGEDGRFALAGVPPAYLTVEMTGDRTNKKETRLDLGKMQQDDVDMGDIALEAVHSASGRLLDAAKGKPCFGANGSARRRDGVSVSVHNASDTYLPGFEAEIQEGGRFVVRDLPADTDSIRIGVLGYMDYDLPNVKLAESGDTPLGDLLLQPVRKYVGTLTEGQGGKPLSSAVSAFVVPHAPGDVFPRTDPLEIADETGRFEYACSLPVLESLEFSCSGYLHHTVAPLPSADEKGRIDLGRIELDAGGRIIGTILGATNTPCRGARLTAQRKRVGDEAGSDNVWTDSDEKGRFNLAGLAEGEYTLFVRKEGLTPKILDGIVVGPSAEPPDLRIVLGAEITLHGTLVDLNARPLAGWQIEIEPLQANCPWASYGGSTNAIGDFEVKNPPAEGIRARFKFERESSGAIWSAEFRTGSLIISDAPMVFVVPLGPQVTGRIVDENGRGLAGVSIGVGQCGPDNKAGASLGMACELQDVNLDVMLATDASGRFRVGPVGIGKADIAFGGDMLVAKKLENVVVGVDDEYDVGDVAVQTAGVLVGRFVDKTTGAPAALSEGLLGDFPCQGQAVCPAIADGVAVSVKQTERASGFRIAGVPRDASAVRLEFSRFLPCRIGGIRVTPGGESDVGDVALDPGVTVRVRLLEADTGVAFGCAQGSTVLMSGGSENADENWSCETRTSDERGVFLFRPAPSDLHQIILTPSDCEPLAIGSVPPVGDKGVVDLGDRKVTRKTVSAGK